MAHFSTIRTVDKHGNCPLPYFWPVDGSVAVVTKVDFLRGAAVSAGGKAIIALPSRTRKGLPRIVPYIQEVKR